MKSSQTVKDSAGLGHKSRPLREVAGDWPAFVPEDAEGNGFGLWLVILAGWVVSVILAVWAIRAVLT